MGKEGEEEEGKIEKEERDGGERVVRRGRGASKQTNDKSEALIVGEEGKLMKLIRFLQLQRLSKQRNSLRPEKVELFSSSSSPASQ